MAVKTKAQATATMFVLSVKEDDIQKIENRKNEIWEAKKNEVALKGFRKGHVPKSQAEKVVGYDNLYEEIVREVFMEGVAASDRKIVGIGQVVIDLFAEGRPVVVHGEVWFEPSVQISKNDYSGIKVEIDPISVSDAEVEAVLQRKREEAAVSMPVEREVQTGDVAVISFKGNLEDGSTFPGNTATDYQVVVGSNTLLAALESQLLGMKAGDSKLVGLTFPEAWSNKTLAGKKANFMVSVSEVKRREVPNLCDTFATSLGYDNLEAARAGLRNDLLLNKKQQSSGTIQQQLLTALLSRAKVEPIPQSMVNRQINSLFADLLKSLNMTKEEYLKKTKATEEDLTAQFEQTARTNINARLILRAVADAENLQVDESERDEFIKNVQPNYPNLSVEELKKQIAWEDVDNNFRVQKAISFVQTQANIIEKTPPQAQVDAPTPTAEAASVGA